MVTHVTLTMAGKIAVNAGLRQNSPETHLTSTYYVSNIFNINSETNDFKKDKWKETVGK